jgi:hypothetical protein
MAGSSSARADILSRREEIPIVCCMLTSR